MGALCSPRVVGSLRLDFHDLQSLVSSAPFAGKAGEELALAIYGYFTSRLDGTYHFWPSDERAGNPRIRRTCVDPIKLVNAYGWTICGQAAHLLYALYRAFGLQARVYGVPGHVLCEVFYEDRWHVLDVDMWTWFRTPRGHIAGASELASDPEGLILNNPNRSNPCNLPDRSLPAYAEMYAKCRAVGDHLEDVRPHWAVCGHNMDFCLRPGETLIRSQRHEGRFPMPQEWKSFMQRFPTEWHGHPRERFEPFRTFGNGRRIYEPSLSARFGDLAEGVWEQDGLRQDDSGLIGQGQATFRIQSPYPFCGVPNWHGEEITTSNGVWLCLAGNGPVEAHVTDAEGKWATVFCSGKAFDERIDITRLLDARYDCLIRFVLGQGTVLRRFRFEGFLMTAPMSIPRLVEGQNPMQLRFGDKHGLRTVPWEEVVDFRDSADPSRQWVQAENARPELYCTGWQMIRPADSAQPVRVVFRFCAPTGRKFAWAYILAIVREGPAGEPPRPAMVEWSLDGQTWKPLADGAISNTQRQWDTTLDGEVLFAEPAAVVWLRVTSGTAICGLEFYGHIGQRRGTADSLEVVHRWVEATGERQFQVPPGEIPYVVECGRDPRDHTIEMRVPSVPAGRGKECGHG